MRNGYWSKVVKIIWQMVINLLRNITFDESNFQMRE